jgi:hypothetical protein
MEGCSIDIPGHTVDNRLRVVPGFPGTYYLQYPSLVTGTVTATIYHNSFALPERAMNVRSPVLVGGVKITDSEVLVDHSTNVRCSTVVGVVKYYKTTTKVEALTEPPVLRLEFWPPPAVDTPLQYTAILSPEVITDLASNATLVIPFNFIQSVFLPIAARNLMDSSFFRGNAIPDTVLASEKKARMMLAKLVPNKTNSPRLIPIG